MASAWGDSWGRAWGDSWGAVATGGGGGAVYYAPRRKKSRRKAAWQDAATFRPVLTSRAVGSRLDRSRLALPGPKLSDTVTAYDQAALTVPRGESRDRVTTVSRRERDVQASLTALNKTLQAQARRLELVALMGADALLFEDDDDGH